MVDAIVLCNLCPVDFGTTLPGACVLDQLLVIPLHFAILETDCGVRTLTVHPLLHSSHSVFLRLDLLDGAVSGSPALSCSY